MCDIVIVSVVTGTTATSIVAFVCNSVPDADAIADAIQYLSPNAFASGWPARYNLRTKTF